MSYGSSLKILGTPGSAVFLGETKLFQPFSLSLDTTGLRVVVRLVEVALGFLLADVAADYL